MGEGNGGAYGAPQKGVLNMSKVMELRAELDRVESAGKELESLEKTRGELVASLDGMRELLVKAKTAYDKIGVEYAEALVQVMELNERGRNLSRETGQPWQTVNLPGRYGYTDNIFPTGAKAGVTTGLVIHENLVPAVFGGDLFELLRAKKARRG